MVDVIHHVIQPVQLLVPTTALVNVNKIVLVHALAHYAKPLVLQDVVHLVTLVVVLLVLMTHLVLVHVMMDVLTDVEILTVQDK